MSDDVDAFWSACHADDDDEVDRLIADGFVERDVPGSWPLHRATFYERHAVVSEVLRHGADVDARDPAGRTPLHLAVFNGDVLAANVLLDAGADVEARDAGGATPLMWAADLAHAGLVLALVERGATTREAVERLGRAGAPDPTSPPDPGADEHHDWITHAMRGG